jgi:molybdate transport system permease protein
MIEAIFLTLKLAGLTTLILVLIGTPLAWWLAQKESLGREIIATLVALPLVLPPTVLGFYLLLAMGPDSVFGSWVVSVFGQQLPFTFTGLVIGSVIYSMPFVVQPIRNAFQAIGPRPMEVAATLGAGPIDRFFNIAIPQARLGIITGSILGFAHTMGEFGVVLMIGGNISGETRVLSIAIYDAVENLNWAQAHWMSAGMLIFSFAVILLMMIMGRRLTATGR